MVTKLERELKERLLKFVSEPNDDETRSRIREEISGFYNEHEIQDFDVICEED